MGWKWWTVASVLNMAFGSLERVLHRSHPSTSGASRPQWPLSNGEHDRQSILTYIDPHWSIKISKFFVGNLYAVNSDQLINHNLLVLHGFAWSFSTFHTIQPGLCFWVLRNQKAGAHRAHLPQWFQVAVVPHPTSRSSRSAAKNAGAQRWCPIVKLLSASGNLT